jgi:hypothetical protein
MHIECATKQLQSGLLASAAAQLLGSFKTDPGLLAREPRFRNLVLIFCYAGLFLNISATIGSFVLTDNLGELGYRASKKENIMGSTSMGAEEILVKYGASRQWNYMLFHCKSAIRFLFLFLLTRILTIRVDNILLGNTFIDRGSALVCMARGDAADRNHDVLHRRTHIIPHQLFYLDSPYFRG